MSQDFHSEMEKTALSLREELVEHPDIERPSLRISANDPNLLSKLQRTADGNKTLADKPDISTASWTLECFGYSTRTQHAAAVLSSAFVCLVVLSGIIIVCLSAPDRAVTKCDLNFIHVDKHPINYNYGPQSVAVGDLNQDTWIDMVVANGIANLIVVYFGSALGTFTKAIEYSTGVISYPVMVSVDDLNSDSKLDVAVAEYDAHIISIFYGYGNGSLRRQVQLSTGASRPISLNLVDLDNDTLLDIVVITYGTYGFSIFYGVGNETFSNPLTYSTGYDSLPYALAIGDLNNDQELDIVVANYGTDDIWIFFANRNGTFEKQLVFSTGVDSHPSSVVVGHLDSDTFLDIAVANYGTRMVCVLVNDGHGASFRRTFYPTGLAFPYSIGVGDFNADGRADLFTTNLGYNNTGLLLGRGDGSFEQLRVTITAAYSSVSFALCDYNKDNRLDAIIVNNDTGGIDILNGYFEGFPSPTNLSVEHPTVFVAVHDMNNDEILDLITLSGTDNTVVIALGSDDGSFTFKSSNTTGSYPCSATVGDFNNDSAMDVAIVNSGSNNMCVLLGRGDGTLSTLGMFSTGAGPRSVVAGDFNNDQRLDVVVANYLNSSVSVFLGYGNGNFTSGMMYSIGSMPQSVTVSDFDNDNRLDLVIPDSDNRKVDILFGYGNGSFSSPVAFPTARGSIFVVGADINRDTQMDIAVVNWDTSTISVLLGHGNGTFAKQTLHGTCDNPTSAAVGDINNDTVVDLVVSCSSGMAIGILFGYGDGSFREYVRFNTLMNSYSIALGDFNKDGRLDLIVANNASIHAGVMLQYNRGALENKLTYAAGGGSKLWSVAISGMTNETHLQIIAANYGTDDISILSYYSNATFRNQQLISMSSNSQPASLTTGDFNGDTQLDIAVVLSGSHQIGILVRNEEQSLTRQAIFQKLLTSAPLCISAADFNNDGQSEIIVGYDDDDSIDLFTAYETGSFADKRKYPVGLNPVYLTLGYLDNDIYIDAVVVNYDSDELSILLGYENGDFSSTMSYSTGPAPDCVDIADFNNDGRSDLVVAHQLATYITVRLGFGNGSFANEIQHTIGFRSTFVEAGDFNNDGRVDVAVALRNNSFIVLLGHGNGSFAPNTLYETEPYPRSVITHDFNNDTHLDLAIVLKTANSLIVFLGYGNGSFAQQETYLVDGLPLLLTAGDLNNDTRLDIVAINTGSGTLSLFLGFGNGSFASVGNLPAGSSTQGAAIADFNKDGYQDLIATSTGDNFVSVFLGRGNGSFANQMKHVTGSTPDAVGVHDFNSDGYVDVIVANSGEATVTVMFGCSNLIFQKQGTLSSGHDSRPSSLAVNDFNNDKYMDIVVAEAHSNQIGLFLGHGDFSFTSLPAFSTNIDSSVYEITTGDFNNDTRLDIAIAGYDSDCVVVFLGLGNGSFTNRTTYPTGASSSPISLVAEYINNDNKLDIIVANYRSNEFAVFLGRGDGTFDSKVTFSTSYGSRPASISVADFNKDGQADVAVINYGTDSLSLHLQTC